MSRRGVLERRVDVGSVTDKALLTRAAVIGAIALPLLVATAADGSSRPNTRTGFWFGVGLGAGFRRRGLPVVQRGPIGKRIGGSANGRHHFPILSSRGESNGWFDSDERYEDAERDHLDAIRISDAALGPTHPNSLVKRANLAACYSSAGDYARAVAPNREVLAGYIGAVGETHPAVGIVRSNLATALLKSGAIDEAMREAVRGYELLQGHFGQENLRTASAGLNVAMAAHALGDTAYADSLYAHVHALFAAASSTWRHHVAIEWGRLRFEQGRCDEALPMLVDAYAYFEETLGADEPRAARAAVWLSLCEDAVTASGRSARTRAHVAALRANVADTHPWLTELPTATP